MADAGRVISESDLRCTATTGDGGQCSRLADFHDYEDPTGPHHLCKQHAAMILWWYADTPQEPPAWAS